VVDEIRAEVRGGFIPQGFQHREQSSIYDLKFEQY
jgi:hypothetical protein